MWGGGGAFFLNFNGILPENETVNFFVFFFFAFFSNIQCKFTKIICISMPHRSSITCIFLAFFMKFNFLAFKKNEKKILKIKMTAIFFYGFVLNILYYRLLFTYMKVCLYAGV